MNFDSLKTLNLDFNEETQNKLIKYIELFKKYNSHTNLISKNDENFLFEKHIYDSLALNLFVNKYDLPEKIMDIGTGGGFPSVPLSVIYPKTEIFAVDSTSKKINFIKEIKNSFDLKNLTPEVCRIEELPEDLKETFDVVTTRALGNLNLILEYAVPYLKTGGYFVAYKSADSENELKKAQNALKVLNTKLIDVIDYKLPLEEDFNRKLLVFKKENSVSKIYPRTYNLMKKNPL